MLFKYLMESRIDSLKEQNPELHYEIDHYLKHALPDNDKSAIDWVIKQHKQGNVNLSHSTSIKSALNKYNANKAIINKPLSKMSYSDLLTHTAELPEPISKNKKKKEIEIVHEDNDIKVEKPLTQEAAQKLAILHPHNWDGKNGKAIWCVSVDDDSGRHYFDKYTNHGKIPMYVVTNKHTHAKTAIIAHPDMSFDQHEYDSFGHEQPHNNYEVRDENDNNIQPHNIQDIHPHLSRVNKLHSFLMGHLPSYAARNMTEHELNTTYIDYENAQGALKNPHLNSSHINDIFDGLDESEHGSDLVYSLFEHPHADKGRLLDTMYDYNMNNDGTDEYVKEHPLHPDILKKIAEHQINNKNHNFDAVVTENPNFNKDVLHHMIKKASDKGLDTSQLAMNDLADEDTYKLLLTHHNEHSDSGAIEAASQTKEHIDLAKNHQYETVRNAVYSNRHLPHSEMEKVISEQEQGINQPYKLSQIEQNPSITQDHINRIAKIGLTHRLRDSTIRLGRSALRKTNDQETLNKALDVAIKTPYHPNGLASVLAGNKHIGNGLFERIKNESPEVLDLMKRYNHPLTNG